MQRAPQTDDGSIVIELTYDMWIGSWRYHGIVIMCWSRKTKQIIIRHWCWKRIGVRSDKRNGNQMKTIFNTMEVIAENM